MEQSWAKVAVVVLCWNGRKLLQEFLPSLAQHQTSDIDIVLADNSSTDDSIEFVKKNFPSVKIIALEKNYGFAAGYNEAINQTGSEFIVLINQDVEVTAGWLAPMLSLIEADQNIAAVQPKILAYNNKSHFEYAGASGGWIDKWGYTFCRGRVFDFVEEDLHQYDDQQEIFWASGACLLTRKKVYQSLGGLDPDFFAHMEEIDFCWRLKNAGYKVFVTPAAAVYHLGGGSLPQGNPFKTYLNFRNNLIMMMKNLPAEKVFFTILFRMILDGVAAFRSLFCGNVRDFFAIWKAHWYFLFHLSRWRKKRMKSVPEFIKMSGVYNRSIVKEYFLKGKKRFSEVVGRGAER